MSWLSTSWEREGKLWKPFSVSPHFQAIFFGGKLDDIECEPVQSLANKNYSQRSVYETLFHAVCLVVFNEYPDHFIFYVIISIINLIEVISLVNGPWLYSKTLLRHEVSVKAAIVSGYMNIFDSERKVIFFAALMRKRNVVYVCVRRWKQKPRNESRLVEWNAIVSCLLGSRGGKSVPVSWSPGVSTHFHCSPPSLAEILVCSQADFEFKIGAIRVWTLLNRKFPVLIRWSV